MEASVSLTHAFEPVTALSVLLVRRSAVHRLSGVFVSSSFKTPSKAHSNILNPWLTLKNNYPRHSMYAIYAYIGVV